MVYWMMLLIYYKFNVNKKEKLRETMSKQKKLN